MPFFSPEKLAQLFFLKEVKPSPDNKMIKILTFENYMYSSGASSTVKVFMHCT